MVLQVYNTIITQLYFPQYFIWALMPEIKLMMMITLRPQKFIDAAEVML